MLAAAGAGHPEVLKALLGAGADVDQGYGEVSALICYDCISKAGPPHFVSSLPVIFRQQQCFHFSTLHQSPDSVLLFCLFAPSPLSQGVLAHPLGRSPLYEAAKQGHKDVVDVLLEYRAKVEADVCCCQLAGASGLICSLVCVFSTSMDNRGTNGLCCAGPRVLSFANRKPARASGHRRAIAEREPFEPAIWYRRTVRCFGTGV